MKIYFLLLLTLYLAGCQSKDANQDAKNDSEAVDYSTSWIDNEPPLRIPTLESVPGPITEAKIKAVSSKRRALMSRLWRLSLIPIPGLNYSKTITAEVAHERYVNFVKTHPSDSLLPLFQQRFARILLNEYHWLETGRPDIIAYYVDQLLISNSADLKTIAASLIQLREKLPPAHFSSLLARARQKADVQLAEESHRLSELAYNMKKRAAPNKVQQDALRQQAIKLKKVYSMDSASVAQLRALPLS